MKRTPLHRRTSLPRQGTPLPRRTPLRYMSRKRSKQQRERAKMVTRELWKRELCEAGVVIYQYRLRRYGQVHADRLNARYARCNGLAVELHEPLTRARGGSILDPANTVAICRSCHMWIHDNPEAATSVGLLEESR